MINSIYMVEARTWHVNGVARLVDFLFTWIYMVNLLPPCKMFYVAPPSKHHVNSMPTKLHG